MVDASLEIASCLAHLGLWADFWQYRHDGKFP